MKNAFEILGAEPTDDSERLRELFDEKQLFSDDNGELNIAYTELTNSKKRIIHEIKFFASSKIKEFVKIFIENNDTEQTKNLDEVCLAIVKVGKFFDTKKQGLFDKINESRLISGFSEIASLDTLLEILNEFKNECMNEVKKYLEYVQEKDLVTLFNKLVIIDNYSSFFVDELLVYYENTIKETMDKKQKDCLNKLNLIQKNADLFIEIGNIHEDFDKNIEKFKKAVYDWDKMAQPLQVNAQQKGAQHETSFRFVGEIRNSVIDLCNKSQEDLNELVQKIRFNQLWRDEFVNKISNSEEFVGLLMKIIDCLIKAFAEIDIMLERLKKDKNDFNNLKQTLAEIASQVVPKQQTTRTYTSASSSSSNTGLSEKGKTILGWVIGIIIFIIVVVLASKNC